jgi:hypothetical protein
MPPRVGRPGVLRTLVTRGALTPAAARSIPITFSSWDIRGPSGYGLLGSLANHGVAEFLLILRRG